MKKLKYAINICAVIHNPINTKTIKKVEKNEPQEVKDNKIIFPIDKVDTSNVKFWWLNNVVSGKLKLSEK